MGLIGANPGIFGERTVLHTQLAALSPRYTLLVEGIETFWLGWSHQAAESWLAYREINMVVLVTSLAADGYLKLEIA